MAQNSMTALVSAFSRAYHASNNEVNIFDDSVAKTLLTAEMYQQIAESMTEGIAFFNPDFTGTKDEALRWIVDNQLSPAPLGRAAFAEQALKTAVSIGAAQYLILGAGYDSFAYRQPAWAMGIQIFELDHPATAADKRQRLQAADIAIPNNVHPIAVDFTQANWSDALMQNKAFHPNKISFCSLLGLTYYLSEQAFQQLLRTLALFLRKGSSLVFDYPDEQNDTDKAGARAKKQALLAEAAKESMISSYSCEQMEALLAAHGFLLYEHLTPADMTRQYFADYNRANSAHPMRAQDNVNVLLAVRSS